MVMKSVGQWEQVLLGPSSPPLFSIQLRSEMESLNAQLDKVNLARSVAESKLSDFDRYKSMIELEITEMLARHKTAMTEKVARSAQVSVVGLQVT